MPQYAEDWRLMFNNARQYNQEGSWVVSNANELQKVFESEYARQMNGTDLPGFVNSIYNQWQSNASYTQPPAAPSLDEFLPRTATNRPPEKAEGIVEDSRKGIKRRRAEKSQVH